MKNETVFSIVNEEPDAEDCKAKIREYEEANKAEIVKRQSQRADEERCIADRIEAEKREAEKRKREFQEGEKAIVLAKRKFKQESTEVMLGVSSCQLDLSLSILPISHTTTCFTFIFIFIFIVSIGERGGIC